MAKIKVDFINDDIDALNNAELRESKIAELHEALDACIECFGDNLKASVTVDTEKE